MTTLEILSVISNQDEDGITLSSFGFALNNQDNRVFLYGENGMIKANLSKWKTPGTTQYFSEQKSYPEFNKEVLEGLFEFLRS